MFTAQLRPAQRTPWARISPSSTLEFAISCCSLSDSGVWGHLENSSKSASFQSREPANPCRTRANGDHPFFSANLPVHSYPLFFEPRAASPRLRPSKGAKALRVDYLYRADRRSHPSVADLSLIAYIRPAISEWVTRILRYIALTDAHRLFSPPLTPTNLPCPRTACLLLRPWLWPSILRLHPKRDRS